MYNLKNYKIKGNSCYLDNSHPTSFSNYLESNSSGGFSPISYNVFNSEDKLQKKIVIRDYYGGAYSGALSDGVAFGTSTVGGPPFYTGTEGGKSYLIRLIKVQNYAELAIALETTNVKDFYYEYNALSTINNVPYIKIWLGLVGAGGGGGQAQSSVGGGGGGGGASAYFPYELKLGEELKITLGEGGSGTTSSSSGRSGGYGGPTKMFDKNDSLMLSVIGGRAGRANGAGGAGGGVEASAVTIGEGFTFTNMIINHGGNGGHGSSSKNTKAQIGFSATRNVIYGDYTYLNGTESTIVGGDGGTPYSGSDSYFFGGGGGAALFEGCKPKSGLGSSTATPQPAQKGGGGCGGSGSTYLDVSAQGSAGGNGAFSIWVPGT